MLRRGTATVSDELKRNTISGVYDAAKAHHKSTDRRRGARFQGMRIVRHQALHEFVDANLLEGYSPEAIAGRLKSGLEAGLPYVSRDTIETYLRSSHAVPIAHELRLFHKRRSYLARKRQRALSRPEPSNPKIYINDRPAEITNRARVGDMEVDFIVSGKNGRGHCLTAVDRKLRYGFIRKILPVTVDNVLEALLDIQRQFPELRSITTDNDTLFRTHTVLEAALGVPFYFTHPYSSWEKGTVENFNGQIRKYIKKRADISAYSDDYIREVEHKLNGRYLSVLGYKKPAEVLEEYRAQ
jgi:IS30 family transposase